MVGQELVLECAYEKHHPAGRSCVYGLVHCFGYEMHTYQSFEESKEFVIATG